MFLKVNLFQYENNKTSEIEIPCALTVPIAPNDDKLPFAMPLLKIFSTEVNDKVFI